jgi:uncharacterized repeat protein (TIGR03803 family)
LLLSSLLEMNFLRRLSRGASCILIGALPFALAGCSGSAGNVSPSIPGQTDMAAAATERSVPASFNVVYNFEHSPNAEFPLAGLLDAGGTLYGTTVYGGTSPNCTNEPYGCGTIFKVTTSGRESVLHSFLGYQSGDGAYPQAPLLDVSGTLYGATLLGGAQNSSSCGIFGCGTVFKISTTGEESVVYRFGGGSDGSFPSGALVDVEGTLFGTTSHGGASGNGCGGQGCGTVFKLTVSGKENVLHSFRGGSDGADPTGGLNDFGGTLYGTTVSGGVGCGTVFKISRSGEESVLYKFTSNTDGCQPSGGLVDVGGTLYGTTVEGGSHNNGIVFAITTSGKERVLYRFAGNADGAKPQGGLIDVDGTLYGTTSGGGGSDNCYLGCGTVFKITTAGKESVLHSFSYYSDGEIPSGLINVAGSLFGTTYAGGFGGRGTLFSIHS